MNGEWNEKEEKTETKKMQRGTFYSETFQKSQFFAGSPCWHTLREQSSSDGLVSMVTCTCAH